MDQGFQSTLPHREWPPWYDWARTDCLFQSTLPHREWLGFYKIWYNFRYFNPHSHTGSDPNSKAIVVDSSISIHTPTQGVTTFRKQIHVKISISIHTPTQGVTEKLCDVRKCKGISIHTPTQGVTSFLKASSVSMLYFNPHSHTGSDAIFLTSRHDG